MNNVRGTKKHRMLIICKDVQNIRNILLDKIFNGRNKSPLKFYFFNYIDKNIYKSTKSNCKTSVPKNIKL